MNSLLVSRRTSTFLALVGAILISAGVASAQDIATLNSELAALEGQVGAAESNPKTAMSMIERLDKAEALFSKLANDPKIDRGSLMSAYNRLDSMLTRLYNTYRKRKDDCISRISVGGDCDYTESEQLALRAVYPLSWLKFQAASSLYSEDANQARRLLNQAIDGFTESTLVLFDPNLVRENLLGRAYCLRELGKYNKADYEKALKDFQTILKDGPKTQQYKAAQQGVATTLAAMGRMQDAEKMTGRMQEQGGASQPGMVMLRLQSIFKAAKSTPDAAKRQQYYDEALQFIKQQENDKQRWPVAVASVAREVPNPVAIYGNRNDGFTNLLLAEVLLAKKDKMGAASHFLKAARSGKYPKGYRLAAGIYEGSGRMDLVEQVVGEMARGGAGVDAQWAAFMRFSLPRTQWRRGGMKNAQLEEKWAAAAKDYLKAYPKGQYAAEVRFFLADRLQRQGQYADAAAEFDQVAGSAYWNFLGRFRAAQANYLALVGAGDSKDVKIDTAALRSRAIDGLRAAIKLAPAAESSTPAQRTMIRDTQGSAIYMLAGLLQRDEKADPKELLAMLAGYEDRYPNMKTRFNDITEWRIKAQDQLGQYAEIERELRSIVERNKGNMAASEFIKILGLELWRSGQMKQARGNEKGFKANAKLTAVAYSYFDDMVAQGKIPAKNLTGTLSILGQAYLADDQVDRAAAIFDQVRKADAASPDANAGLARIAQKRKQWKDAVELWTTVESVAAESDDLWYEAQYNVALIYLEQGKLQDACNKLAVTRAEHPTLGTPEMKARWDALQRKHCLDGRRAGR